jgi:hypothetical protein
MNAAYRFLPWVRQGASTAVRTPDTLGPGVPGRPGLPVGLRVNGRSDISVALRMYGPGDVAGFDTRVVRRTDPPNLASASEPNYFAGVELSVPSLPWLLTPATGEARGRLRPWMALVVVRQQPGVSLAPDRDRPLPILRIAPPAVPAAELPDLAESWAWAHTQVMSSDDSPVRELLKEENGVVSRLLCPRRLQAGASYVACLVPAFAAGRRAGLAELPDPSDDQLQPAWVLGELGEALELPVYFHWSFTTGIGGDFESLVRRLRGQPVPEGVGTRMLRLGNASFGFPDGGSVPLQGALRPPEGPPDPGIPSTFATALVELLNLPEALRENGGSDDPIVAPPIYGSWQAAQRRLDAATPAWVREMNADPRHRAAAGLGTIIVQDQQEQLMASAWQQLGDAAHTQERTQRRELGRTVLSRVHRSMEQLAPDAFLRITGPLHARVRLDAAAPSPEAPVGSSVQTVHEQIRVSAVPVAVMSSSFRRVTRPLGPLVRRLSVATGTVAPDTGATAGGGATVGGAAAAGGATLTSVTTGTAAPGGGVGGAIPASTIGGITATTTTVTTGTVFGPIGPIKTATFGVSFSAIRQAATGTAATAMSVRTLHFAARFAPDAVLARTAPRALPAGGTVSAAAIDSRLQGLIVLSTMLAESARFRAAAGEVSGYLARMVGGGTPQPKPGLHLSAIKLEMLTKMDPAVTLPPAVTPSPAGSTGTGEEAPPIPEAAGSEVRSLPGPSFPQPMYEFLRDIAPDLLLPGLELIPPDSAMLLETNPAFIEAFMVGLNHEMSRELLWREYPSDLRGTCFRHFWGGRHVMPEIHDWAGDGALGSHLDAGTEDQQLVLLIRAEVLQRYPGTVIYASPAVNPLTPGEEKRYPVFRAALGPDVTCLGFNLTPDQVRGGEEDPGWFFLLEQPPGQPRFGLDESAETGRDPATLTSWNQLAWGDVVEGGEALATMSHVKVEGRLLGHRIGGLEWGLNAGHMAAITLQRPVRVLLHASKLLPPEEAGDDA